jgi:hypothetical protein
VTRDSWESAVHRSSPRTDVTNGSCQVGPANYIHAACGGVRRWPVDLGRCQRCDAACQLSAHYSRALQRVMYSHSALLHPSQTGSRICASRSSLSTPYQTPSSSSQRQIAANHSRSPSSCRNTVDSVSSRPLHSGLSLVLAGAVVFNTLTAPLLLPLPALSALLQAEDSSLTAHQLQPKEPRATVAEVSSLPADTETNEQQQQWWQQDEQVSWPLVYLGSGLTGHWPWPPKHLRLHLMHFGKVATNTLRLLVPAEQMLSCEHRYQSPFLVPNSRCSTWQSFVHSLHTYTCKHQSVISGGPLEPAQLSASLPLTPDTSACCSFTGLAGVGHTHRADSLHELKSAPASLASPRQHSYHFQAAPS